MEYRFLFGTVISLLPGTYLEVRQLDHMVDLFLIFLGTSICLPQWLYQFTFP